MLDKSLLDGRVHRVLWPGHDLNGCETCLAVLGRVWVGGSVSAVVPLAHLSCSSFQGVQRGLSTGLVP